MTRKPAPFSKIAQLTVASLTVFCWLGIWILFESVPLFFRASAQTTPAFSDSQSAPPAPHASVSEVDLKTKDLDRQMDYIQKLLAALVTVGTIFGLALGVTSYINAKDLQRNAEKALDKLKDSADKQLENIRADFPAIAGVNNRITVILREISLFGNLKLDELDGKNYDQLKPSEKQEILLQEMTFSALNCFDHARSAALKDSAARVNGVFGRFYGSRFHFDPVGNAPDLPRAIIYNSHALQTEEKETLQRANGALGVLHLWQSFYEKDPKQQAYLRLLARGYYDDARTPGIVDPKRLVALAWMDRRESNVQHAIDQLDEVALALEGGKLSPREVSRFAELVYKNRACYRAEQGQLALVIGDLWKSRTAANRYGDFAIWVKGLDRECEPEGDFFKMMSQGDFRDQVALMRDPESQPPA